MNMNMNKNGKLAIKSENMHGKLALSFLKYVIRLTAECSNLLSYKGMGALRPDPASKAD